MVQTFPPDFFSSNPPVYFLTIDGNDNTAVKYTTLTDVISAVGGGGGGGSSTFSDIAINSITTADQSFGLNASTQLIFKDISLKNLLVIDENSGIITVKDLNVESDGYILNSDAVGSGADWTYTIQRPVAGMTAAVILTLPINDGTPGQILQTDGTGILSWATAAGVNPTIANVSNNSISTIDQTISLKNGTSFIIENNLGVDFFSIINDTGIITLSTLNIEANNYVLNSNASGAGSDWTYTIQRPVAGMTAAVALTLPIDDGIANQTLITNGLGVLSWASFNTPQYITLSTSPILDNERVLTGTTNQINLADSGAGGNITLSTPQDIHTAASPIFLGLNITGDSYIINSDAVGSGADWTYTIQRPVAGMTAAVTLTLPIDDGISGQVLQTDGTGILSWISGGAGGAPPNAQYVTLAADASLSNERVLTGTTNQINLVDSGAGLSITLSTPQDIHTAASPIFLGLNITGDSYIINSDAAGSGADWTYTIQRPVAGMTAAIALTLPADDGTPGQVLQTDGTGILSWITGGAGGAPTNSQYVTLAADASLSNERVLTGTTNQINLADSGAGGNITLSTPQDIHTAASPIFLGLNITGDSYIINSDAIGSGADWTYTIQRPVAGMTAAVTLTLPIDDGITNQFLQTDGTGILSWTTIGAGVVAINDLSDVTISTVTDNEVLTYDNASGQWINETFLEAGIAPLTSQYVTLAADASLSNERVLTGTTNQINLVDSGAGLSITLSTPQDIHTAASPIFLGLNITGDSYIINSDAIGSGADWTYTIQRPVAGMTAAVTLTLPIDDGVSGQFLQTNGTGILSWVTESTDAPTNAQYVTLAINSVLSNERVLTGTTNQINLADSGAGGNITLSTPQDIHTAASPIFLGLNITGDSYIINSDAIGSGADWTYTIQRPVAGMTAAVTLTLPIDDGITNQFLQTDGTGILSWSTVALLNVAQEYTKTQNFNATTLMSTSGSIAWDVESNQVVSHTATENTTLANPTNMKDGATYIFRWIQHATAPKTLAFGTAYKFPGGTAFTVTATNNAIDIITFICDGTNMYSVSQPDFK